MRAFRLNEAHGPASARMEDIETPEPGAGEARVALRAASLNHRELWISRGQYPGMALPTTLGADGAGIVDAVGPGVDDAPVGREVVLYPGLEWGGEQRFPGPRFGLLGMPGPGTIAEHVVVPVDNLATKPASLSFEAAAALPVAALTAWRALTVCGQARPGESVLITGIGGGVASFALQFAVARGNRVWVTSSAQASLDHAVSLGAQGGFLYTAPDWRKTVARTTGGIDVVIEGAPAAGLPNYMRALSMGARIVVYGSTGGISFETAAPELFLRHARIVGTAMGSPEDFRAMLDFVETERLTPAIDRVFALEEEPAALAHLESGHGFGKVVIRI